MSNMLKENESYSIQQDILDFAYASTSNMILGNRGCGRTLITNMLFKQAILKELSEGKDIVVVCHTDREEEIKELLSNIDSIEIVAVDYIPKSAIYSVDKSKLEPTFDISIEIGDIKND